MEYAVAFIALCVMGYALVEHRLVTTIITGPMVFMTLGFLGGNRGFDIIDPIQPECMDPVEVKERYGDRIVLHGCGSLQKTLPFGTPDDVRSEIRTRLSTIGAGGGLILGPTHHVQLDTPMENFWAMVKTIRGTENPKR